MRAWPTMVAAQRGTDVEARLSKGMQRISVTSRDGGGCVLQASAWPVGGQDAGASGPAPGDRGRARESNRTSARTTVCLCFCACVRECIVCVVSVSPRVTRQRRPALPCCVSAAYWLLRWGVARRAVTVKEPRSIMASNESKARDHTPRRSRRGDTVRVAAARNQDFRNPSRDGIDRYRPRTLYRGGRTGNGVTPRGPSRRGHPLPVRLPVDPLAHCVSASGGWHERLRRVPSPQLTSGALGQQADGGEARRRLIRLT